MKAIVQSGYGAPSDVLGLLEVPMPVVGDDDVRVNVRAASLHPDVWHVVLGLPHILRVMGAGLRKPTEPIPGTDFSGTVESVGKNVTDFNIGDEVFGESLTGLQWNNGGTFAEYVCAPADNLALKPANVTFEQAATVPTAGLIVLLNLRGRAQIKPGQRVLINGAGGGVGSIALQVAKANGANVTAVDATHKLDMLRSLGADQVVDYTKENFTQGSERYDLVFDIPGNHLFNDVKRVIEPSGAYVLIGHQNFGVSKQRVFGLIPHFMKLMGVSLFNRQLPRPDFSTPPKGEMMAVLSQLLESGKLTPIVDRTFPLAEIHEAMRYMETANAPGRIVLIPGAPS